MGFLSGVFGPGYKQKNPEVRKDSIKTLTDKVVLADLAENDIDAGVREAAKIRLESLKK